jgi:hypothetical protein
MLRVKHAVKPYSSLFVELITVYRATGWYCAGRCYAAIYPQVFRTITKRLRPHPRAESRDQEHQNDYHEHHEPPPPQVLQSLKHINE